MQLDMWTESLPFHRSNYVSGTASHGGSQWNHTRLVVRVSMVRDDVDPGRYYEVHRSQRVVLVSCGVDVFRESGERVTIGIFQTNAEARDHAETLIGRRLRDGYRKEALSSTTRLRWRYYISRSSYERLLQRNRNHARVLIREAYKMSLRSPDDDQRE